MDFRLSQQMGASSKLQDSAELRAYLTMANVTSAPVESSAAFPVVGQQPWLPPQLPCAGPSDPTPSVTTSPFSSLLVAAGQVLNAEEQRSLQQKHQQEQLALLIAQEEELNRESASLIQQQQFLQKQRMSLQLGEVASAVMTPHMIQQQAAVSHSLLGLVGAKQESDALQLNSPSSYLHPTPAKISPPHDEVGAPPAAASLTNVAASPEVRNEKTSLRPLKKRKPFVSEEEGDDRDSNNKQSKKPKLVSSSKKKDSQHRAGKKANLPVAVASNAPVIIHETTDKDVLSIPSRGRGYDPPGNRIFHAMCKEFHDFYLQAQSKLEKTAVVSFLVDKIQSGGGRFLRRNDRKEDIQEEISWVELSKEEAVQKTRDVLIRLCSKKRENYLKSA